MERSHFLGIDVALDRLDYCMLQMGSDGRLSLLIRPHVVRSARDLLVHVTSIVPPETVLAGIDAPLSLPAAGIWRECDRALRRSGIPCYPPLMQGFERVTHFGMSVARELRDAGIECLEVYPYGARKRLEIAPGAKKQTSEGRRAIRHALARYVDMDTVADTVSHDALDAILAALTAAFAARGWAETLSGPEGSVTIPCPLAALREKGHL